MTKITYLLTIMARLRNPEGGCPWDLEQNFSTIAPYTIEEAYEVAEAIARGDRDELRDELGDLLLQVVFHSQMAAEEGSFTFEDVVKSICDKMVRRHPHVFADTEIKTADAQTANWETIKEAERKAKAKNLAPITSPLGESLPRTRSGVENPLGFSGEGQLRTLEGIPLALPALMRAQKLQARAARVGFDWPDVSGVIAKIREELSEVEEALAAGDKAHLHEELGDLLFAVTNLARFVGDDAETSLRDANAKFTRRFEHVEDGLRAQGKSMKDATLDEMEALWVKAKEQA